MKQFKNWIAK
uniref:Uncharacterized protein n=1 Tax=Arundo donax TaxID=35708 RepID=A0A0A8ZME2_ARUDO